MGNAGSSNSLGKKISDGFNSLGKGISDGWESVKSFGKKTFEDIKRVPVLGQIVGGLEKAADYTGISNVLKTGFNALDTGIGVGTKVLQGDLKGGISKITNYTRDTLNQKIPILEDAKKVPVLGKIIEAGQMAVENAPVIPGGLSINAIRSIGNAAANSLDAFKEGDIAGGFKQGLSAVENMPGLPGKILSGVKTVQNVVNGVETGGRVINALKQGDIAGGLTEAQNFKGLPKGITKGINVANKVVKGVQAGTKVVGALQQGDIAGGLEQAENIPGMPKQISQGIKKANKVVGGIKKADAVRRKIMSA